MNLITKVPPPYQTQTNIVLYNIGAKYFDNPSDFVQCSLLLFLCESGLNPYLGNGNAYGLFQMLDSTAKGLKIDFNLFKASGWNQLNYYDSLIKAQFKIGIPKNFIELYLLNFYPKYLNKPLDSVFPDNVIKANYLPANCTVQQWYNLIIQRVNKYGYSNVLNLELKKKIHLISEKTK
jgi:hypothetical protein